MNNANVWICNIHTLGMSMCRRTVFGVEEGSTISLHQKELAFLLTSTTLSITAPTSSSHNENQNFSSEIQSIILKKPKKQNKKPTNFWYKLDGKRVFLNKEKYFLKVTLIILSRHVSKL